MSLFSEMAALKAEMQLRSSSKVSFHLQFSIINTLGRKTSTCCKVVIGRNTPFSDLLRIYCEARSISECLLPPSVSVRRAYRKLFLKHFRRNMFYYMNAVACYGNLVCDRRVTSTDCIALTYDFMSPSETIPRISKVIYDPLCYPNQSACSITD